MLQDTHRHILLIVPGGIACYKTPEIVRLLQKQQYDVRVMLTEHATQFIGTTTFEALTHHECICSFQDPHASAIAHIQITDWADCICVVPATANIIAKMAHGIADDICSTTLLATNSPVVVAPAMNTRMWNHPATQSNCATLCAYGYTIVTPEKGLLACGTNDQGHLANVTDIVSAIDSAMCQFPQDLQRKHVLITAGPTHEYIDPVRFISNPSSGKMGLSLARACKERGAKVTVVLGPTNQPIPNGVQAVHVVSAQEMYNAALETFSSCDIAICTAAVGDFAPVAFSQQKIKKTADDEVILHLRKNKDILATLCAKATPHQKVIGFAAETNNCVTNAQEKLARKHCDMIVLNDVSQSDSGFSSDYNQVQLITKDSSVTTMKTNKYVLAHTIIDAINKL